MRPARATLLLLLLSTLSGRAAAANLVRNPSVETADPANAARPASWRTGNPGTKVCTFSWAAGGRSGDRAVRVDVTSYTSGDAKWYFDPVTVATVATYVYRDWYQATITTKVVAAYTLADGTTRYQTLGTVPASAAWASAVFTLVPPAAARKATVYHLLAGVGSLLLDDVSLSALGPPDLSSGVPNGTLEEPEPFAPDRPLAWSTGRYGTNRASFAYLATGHGGPGSVSVTVSGWASGDAKWYFAPQPVTPGGRYHYADFYLADARSFLLVRYTLEDGSFQYGARAVAPPAPSWTEAHLLFTAPAGAIAATVYRGLATNGTLTLDDARLETLPPILVTDGVPNSDLEQELYPGASAPAGWTTNAWGENGAVFTWAVDGHSGLRSARVDLPTYTSGTASWSFGRQPVSPGATLAFSDWYRSDVETTVQVQFTAADGAVTWLTLPRAWAAADWTRYSARFVVPLTAVEATVFHLIDRVGYLQLDDAAMRPAPTLPLRRALASVTFDDGWSSDADVLPILEIHGAVATHYVITDLLGEPGRLSPAQLAELQAHGHEIASHSASHPDLTLLSGDELQWQLVASGQALAALGVPATGFASPHGLYTQATLSEVARFYGAHRSMDTGYNTLDDVDVTRLRVQKVFATTTPEDVDAWAAQAAADRSWLILVYHSVTEPAASGPYGTTRADFEQHLASLAGRGLGFVTVRDGVDELAAQRALAVP